MLLRASLSLLILVTTLLLLSNRSRDHFSRLGKNEVGLEIGDATFWIVDLIDERRRVWRERFGGLWVVFL